MYFSGQEPFLVLVDGGPAQACENYDPLGEPDLEIKFSELKTPADALNFANRFGLLGFAEEAWRLAYPELRRGLDESISDWLSEAGTASDVLTIWTAVQANDRYGLRRIIQRDDKNRAVARFEGHRSYTIAGTGSDEKWLRPFKPQDVIGLAKIFLASAVNRSLRKSADVGVTLSSSLEFQPRLTPINLLSAIWIRISEVLTGVRSLRPCEICKGLIDVTNNRSHKRVHTKCSVKMRVRKWRENQ